MNSEQRARWSGRRKGGSRQSHSWRLIRSFDFFRVIGLEGSTASTAGRKKKNLIDLLAWSGSLFDGITMSLLTHLAEGRSVTGLWDGTTDG